MFVCPKNNFTKAANPKAIKRVLGGAFNRRPMANKNMYGTAELAAEDSTTTIVSRAFHSSASTAMEKNSLRFTRGNKQTLLIPIFALGLVLVLIVGSRHVYYGHDRLITTELVTSMLRGGGKR